MWKYNNEKSQNKQPSKREIMKGKDTKRKEERKRKSESDIEKTKNKIKESLCTPQKD
jgi:hypothetical protein